MAIAFFFEYDKLLVQLPVNPGEIKIKSPGNNNTTEIVKLGEINLLRDPKLSECNIESFLPVDKDAPYVLTSGKFKTPQFYVDFFNKVRHAKKPMRLIVSDTKINMLVGIENFDYGLVAQDEDTHYVLELKEYKPFTVRELQVIKSTSTSVTVANSNSVTRQKTGFAIGDNVIVNGNYYYSSYGDNPHSTFKNFEGKISIIVPDKKRPCRYHISTQDGGARGWVNESQLKHNS